MKEDNSQRRINIQKQIIRVVAVLFLVGAVYAGRALITNLENTSTSVEGHAPLKTNVQFLPVEGEPTEVAGYGSLKGTVERVIDGDTVEFLTSTGHTYRLHLLGVDAPELQQGDSGKISKGYLQKVLGYCENHVTVIYKEDESYDPYGRLLGKVLCDGKDINLDLIKAGHAWVYIEYLHDLLPSDQEQYLKAEESAQQRKLGLWSEKSPEEPWEWRLKAKDTQTSSKLKEWYSWVRKRLGF
ncbi:MAG: thermonuclease family protein [Burkholderiales bacterium]|nr:thermonuclease family protein [Burkholderiales bacterium]